MTKDYEINEADIERIISYIKLTDPDNATPEMAITVLENMYAKYHVLSHEEPEILDAIFKDIKDKKTD